MQLSRSNVSWTSCHLPFISTYLGDLLIASCTPEEHLLHILQIFQVLQDSGLIINPAKCVFTISSLKFLGHMVDEAQTRCCRSGPNDIKRLEHFLGLISFYWHILPAATSIRQLLTDLLKGSPKVLRSPAADATFVATKARLHWLL
jgi:hypothetical protein